ncbi:hypothetical protein [Paenibacillus sp. Soil522]|uniref:hypothetical protein n=1 Tax=Paenibacillus sp. Soil522 TaxID=1736388 RepID=UPI0006F79635|nr:hypothetical protein [Paenibacillus sp. Soil522]KRE45380.1 hypothetical protein ASG81_13280 [Paenibacillus sp. Soil522]
MIKQKLARHFEERKEGLVFRIDSKIGIVMRGGRDQFDAKHLNCEFEEALAAVNTSFIAFAGGAVKAVADIGKSYFEATELMKKEFFPGREKSVIDNTFTIVPQEAPDTGTLSNKFCQAFDTGNRSLMCRMLEEGLLSIAHFDGAEQAVKTLTAQWISLTLTKLSKRNEIAQLAVQDVFPIISDIYEQPDYRTLQQMLEDRLTQLLDRLELDDDESVVKQVTLLAEVNLSTR